jgi:hypothetical protein
VVAERGDAVSRAETIGETSSWRVRVRITALESRVTHESSFRSLEKAREYYEALHVPGSEKTIEVRAAGKNRYAVVVSEAMKAERP